MMLIILNGYFFLFNFNLLAKLTDSLDTWEDMTEVGLHLINFPIGFKFSKMILYAIGLKCLDPILTIVSSLSIEDPCKLF